MVRFRWTDAETLEAVAPDGTAVGHVMLGDGGWWLWHTATDGGTTHSCAEAQHAIRARFA